MKGVGRSTSLHDRNYMRMAAVVASYSPDYKTKVGCVIKGRNGASPAEGYNRNISGNWLPTRDADDETLETVIHAEQDAIANAAKTMVDTLGATMFVTRAPCVRCAMLVIAAGVKKVVYGNNHSDDKGLKLMMENGIEVRKIS